MKDSRRFKVVLDACVLYPAPVRDILLSLASEGLFRTRWSNTIQEEWVRNLLINRSDLNGEQLDQTVKAMNAAFPDANVDDFEGLIANIRIPDEDDRHVVACAIKCKADLIVTFNTKDFPKKELSKYDLETQKPDEFISNLIDTNPKLGCKAFSKMVKRLKKPTKTKKEVLAAFEKCRLKNSAERIRVICKRPSNSILIPLV